MDEILICGKGFVRSVIWDSNDFKVTDQFNSSDQGGDLSIPQWLDTDGDGKKELLPSIPKDIGRGSPNPTLGAERKNRGPAKHE